MCFFAQLGMLMFGGALYPGNPALTNSSFHELGYYPSNFNDFASSLVVLFVRLPQPPPCQRLSLPSYRVLLRFNVLGCWRQDLLVVNNWTVMMEGAVLAAGVHSLAATLFFIIYYIVVVVVVLNLVIAYVIERYDEQFRLDHMLSQLLAVVDDHDAKHSHTAKDMDDVFHKHSVPRSALALAAGSDEPAGQGQGDDGAEEEEARVLEAAKVPAALAELETLKFTDWARCGPTIRQQSARASNNQTSYGRVEAATQLRCPAGVGAARRSRSAQRSRTARQWSCQAGGSWCSRC